MTQALCSVIVLISQWVSPEQLAASPLLVCAQSLKDMHIRM